MRAEEEIKTRMVGSCQSKRLARCGLVREQLSVLPTRIAAVWHWPFWGFNLPLWRTGWGLSLCTRIIPCHKLPAAYCLHSMTRAPFHHHSPGGGASTLADAQPQNCYYWGLWVGLGLSFAYLPEAQGAYKVCTIFYADSPLKSKRKASY